MDNSEVHEAGKVQQDNSAPSTPSARRLSVTDIVKALFALGFVGLLLLTCVSTLFSKSVQNDAAQRMAKSHVLAVYISHYADKDKHGAKFETFVDYVTKAPATSREIAATEVADRWIISGVAQAIPIPEAVGPTWVGWTRDKTKVEQFKRAFASRLVEEIEKSEAKAAAKQKPAQPGTK